MAKTRDPIGEFLDLPEADADPTIEGQIGYRAGSFRLLDSVGVFDPRTGGTGLTPATHRPLDQLVHGIAEDSFEEVTYTGNKVDSIIVWTTAGKTQKIREELFTYTGNNITTIVTKQYDGSGVLIAGETMTETIAYAGNKVSSYTRVMS